MHALHFVKKLPLGCFDPNHGQRGTKQVLPGWHKFWTLGISMNLMIRLGEYDAYGKNGFGCLVEKFAKTVDGKTCYRTKVCLPEKITNYMSKYVTKSLEKVQYWRTKISRGFGLERIDRMVSQLKTSEIEEMIREKMTLKVKRNQYLPRSLTQRSLIKHWLLRKKPEWSDLLTLEPQKGMLVRLLILTKPKPGLN